MTVAGMLLIAGTLLATPPEAELAVLDTVDVVEINHLYDMSTNPPRSRTTQLIFWDWDPGMQAHVVRSFRVIKSPEQYPQRDHARDGYLCLWYDHQRLRLVRARSLRETWTGTDPEIDNLSIRRGWQRQGLQGDVRWIEQVGEMLRHLVE